MDDRVACPYCGEDIPSIARKCRHCGEFIDPAAAPDAREALPHLALGVFLGVVLLALLCVVGSIVATAAAPGLQRAETARNEAAAVAALRAVVAAQEAFRSSDPDRNGVADFGDLAQLGAAHLLDPGLVTGIHEGYQLEVAASRTEPRLRWIAVASPLTPGRTGDRFFAVNHAGAVHVRTSRPFPLDVIGCELPGDARPVGP
ncbi:MAG: zinc ribbon domain-containing protein [Planctomycetes bacterium]|nr:zinc ribbon domain-containing protein [Planctomycetota bacterium]